MSTLVHDCNTSRNSYGVESRLLFAPQNSLGNHAPHGHVSLDCCRVLLTCYSRSSGSLLCYAYNVSFETEGEKMFASMIAGDRFLGFDPGDWTMLVGGLCLAGILALLV